MTIIRLLQKTAFGPDEIAALSAAYERALAALGLRDRSDPVTQLVAKKIIEAAQTGLRDPAQIYTAAINDLGIAISGGLDAVGTGSCRPYQS